MLVPAADGRLVDDDPALDVVDDDPFARMDQFAREHASTIRKRGRPAHFYGNSNKRRTLAAFPVLDAFHAMDAIALNGAVEVTEHDQGCSDASGVPSAHYKWLRPSTDSQRDLLASGCRSADVYEQSKMEKFSELILNKEAHHMVGTQVVDVERTGIPKRELVDLNECSAELVIQAGIMSLVAFTSEIKELIAAGAQPICAFISQTFDETSARLRVSIRSVDVELDTVDTNIRPEVGAAGSAKLFLGLLALRVCIRVRGAYRHYRIPVPCWLVSADHSTAEGTIGVLQRWWRPFVPYVNELFGLFPLTGCFTNTDGCSSNIKAWACLLEGDGPRFYRWNQLCFTHRIATAMTMVSAMVPEHVSGLIAVALCLNPTGALQKLRAVIAMWMLARLRIYKGAHPETTGNAAAFRKLFVRQYFPAGTQSIAFAKVVFESVANGHFGIRWLEHYCPDRCCSSAAETRIKVNLLASCLAHTLMPVFPRSRWTGSIETISYFGRLSFCGAIQDIWPALMEWIGSKRKAPTIDTFTLASNDRWQHVTTAPVSLPLGHALSNALPAIQDEIGASAASTNQKHDESLPEFNSRMKGKATRFVHTLPAENNLLFRMALEPFADLLHDSLNIGSDDFSTAAASKLKKDGGMLYRMTSMETAVETFFSKVQHLRDSPDVWAGLLPGWQTSSNALTTFRMINRGAGHIAAQVESVLHSYFDMLLFVLVDPSLADMIKGDACLWDPITQAHMEQFGDLLSPESLVVLESMALELYGDMSRLEARWACMRRLIYLRSTISHAPSLTSNASDFLFKLQLRVERGAAIGAKQPLPFSETRRIRRARGRGRRSTRKQVDAAKKPSWRIIRRQRRGQQIESRLGGAWRAYVQRELRGRHLSKGWGTKSNGLRQVMRELGFAYRQLPDSERHDLIEQGRRMTAMGREGIRTKRHGAGPASVPWTLAVPVAFAGLDMMELSSRSIAEFKRGFASERRRLKRLHDDQQRRSHNDLVDWLRLRDESSSALLQTYCEARPAAHGVGFEVLFPLIVCVGELYAKLTNVQRDVLRQSWQLRTEQVKENDVAIAAVGRKSKLTLCRKAGRCLCKTRDGISLAQFEVSFILALKVLCPAKSYFRKALVNGEIVLKLYRSGAELESPYWFHIASSNLSTWTFQMLCMRQSFSPHDIARAVPGTPLVFDAGASYTDTWSSFTGLNYDKPFTLELWRCFANGRHISDWAPCKVQAIKASAGVGFWQPSDRLEPTLLVADGGGGGGDDVVAPDGAAPPLSNA